MAHELLLRSTSIASSSSSSAPTFLRKFSSLASTAPSSSPSRGAMYFAILPSTLSLPRHSSSTRNCSTLCLLSSSPYQWQHQQSAVRCYSSHSSEFFSNDALSEPPLSRNPSAVISSLPHYRSSPSLYVSSTSCISFSFSSLSCSHLSSFMQSSHCLAMIPRRTFGGETKKTSDMPEDLERQERKQRASGKGKGKGIEVDIDEGSKTEASSDKEGLRKIQQWVAEVLKYREYHPLVETRSPQQLAIDRELAKRYSRYQMHEHRLLQRILKAKLRAKWAAINALPDALKEQALKVDDSSWPMSFLPPTSDLAPKKPPFPPPYIPNHLRTSTQDQTQKAKQ